jgi:hypothetical protein
MIILPEIENRENYRSFSTLTRTLTLSQGCFSLLLVRCNCTQTQKQTVRQLLKVHKVQQLTVPKSTKTLYNFIHAEATARNWLNSTSPLSGLSICGLESASCPDKLWQEANFMRDRFPGAFPFPLIFWVTDEVHKKLIRLAPDLENIATSGISFVPGP